MVKTEFLDCSTRISSRIVKQRFAESLNSDLWREETVICGLSNRPFYSGIVCEFVQISNCEDLNQYHCESLTRLDAAIQNDKYLYCKGTLRRIVELPILWQHVFKKLLIEQKVGKWWMRPAYPTVSVLIRINIQLLEKNIPLCQSWSDINIQLLEKNGFVRQPLARMVGKE